MGNLLAPESELGDQRSIPLDILATQVIEEATSLTDHHQEAATTVMVVLVVSQMLGEVADSLREQSNLDLGGPCVALVCAELGNNFCWCLHCA